MGKIIGIDARLWYESGVGRYIRNLVLGLDHKKSTHYEFVIFLPTKAFRENVFESQNFKKIATDISWHSISEQISFKKLIDKEKVDLMHFPYFSYPVFYNKPFVITIHDLIIDHFPTGKSTTLPLPIYYLKRYVYKKITKSAVKNSQRIIVPSVATKEEIIKHYHATGAKISVIHEGFDELIQNQKTKNTLKSKNYILYVGNAYPHKNLENFLTAFKKLREEVKIDLICIGRNDFFYKRLEDKIFDGVYFLHNVDDSELFDYYKHAKCTVVPSLMEGFGLPLLEAMSLSCPVVSSDASALKEIGDDACLFFDPKDVDDIKSKIKSVIESDRLSQKYSKKGLLRSQMFSWDKCVDETLKIYESCNSV